MAAPRTRILREKTRVSMDGRVRQECTMVNVAAPNKAPKLRLDVKRVREPVYDSYSGEDHVRDENDGRDDEEGGRDLRDSDDPLWQWAEDHRDTFLAEVLRLEGRGDHRESRVCAACSLGPADHRCVHCLGGGELLCASCIVMRHAQLPFHRIQWGATDQQQFWTGRMFERKTLKELGLRIQLGHWHGAERRCPVPTPASGEDFVIVDNLGVHKVALDYCGCGQGGASTVQLLRAQFFPATTTNPRTAATFSVLRIYHLLSFESKCAAYEFYQSLARETDNMRYKRAKSKKKKKKATMQPPAQDDGTEEMKDRYHEFLRMTQEWRHLQMLKRAGRGHDPAGVAGTRQGECALLCPACPQPGKNLPPDWADAPEEKQFLYALFLAMDANFRLKRKDVSTEEKDPGLGKGWAFYCEVKAYMKHVAANWNQKQEARGTASSGIGAVDCARHNMKRPNAGGDLQLGERSIAGSDLVRFFVSYDIACQWHTNIWIRMEGYKNEEITIRGGERFMTFLVPKFHLPAHIEACNLRFSFNLTRDVGMTDGEAPERGWSDANPLARSTKKMGPGSRRDTLDDHFNDWNHKKIVALGYALRKKMENAVPEMVKTRRALADMDESLGSEPVAEWTTMATKWEKDPDAPNPFETLRKDEHLAKVRSELAAEAAQRAAEGNEVAGDVRGDMHITELIAMGLQLEGEQLRHQRDGFAPDRRPATSKLRRKVFAWIDVQAKFFLGLATLREMEDEARARAAETQPIPGVKVSDIALWLPSAIVAAPGPTAKEVACKEEVLSHEYRLRVGQANEMLHEVRCLLLVRTHLYKLKDTQSRGVRANTRSGDKIAALNDRIKRAAVQYRVARRALVKLGRALKRNDWAWALLDLKEEDVRGLPRAQFSDPEKKKRRRKRSTKKARLEKEPELSWIWINRGGRHEPGDEVAMNEAVRVEWAKARARCLRWGKEVDLLEEEMRRVQQFLLWHSDWWAEQVNRRVLPEGAQLEGETVYATRQATLQSKLCTSFTTTWKALPQLIREGRAGRLAEEEEDGDEDTGEEEEGSSREEEAAICLVAQEAVKSTYVDEILTYA
ncbi:hypothetical protein C8R44DRAFT_751892 [Mycena epipterygia]|nr:hypothetical protein C8R44DRAFT_751892 [Mycena epipterygia]